MCVFVCVCVCVFGNSAWSVCVHNVCVYVDIVRVCARTWCVCVCTVCVSVCSRVCVCVCVCGGGGGVFMCV